MFGRISRKQQAEETRQRNLARDVYVVSQQVKVAQGDAVFKALEFCASILRSAKTGDFNGPQCEAMEAALKRFADQGCDVAALRRDLIRVKTESQRTPADRTTWDGMRKALLVSGLSKAGLLDEPESASAHASPQGAHAAKASSFDALIQQAAVEDAAKRQQLFNESAKKNDAAALDGLRRHCAMGIPSLAAFELGTHTGNKRRAVRAVDEALKRYNFAYNKEERKDARDALGAACDTYLNKKKDVHSNKYHGVVALRQAVEFEATQDASLLAAREAYQTAPADKKFERGLSLLQSCGNLADDGQRLLHAEVVSQCLDHFPVLMTRGDLDGIRAQIDRAKAALPQAQDADARLQLVQDMMFFNLVARAFFREQGKNAPQEFDYSERFAAIPGWEGDPSFVADQRWLGRIGRMQQIGLRTEKSMEESGKYEGVCEVFVKDSARSLCTFGEGSSDHNAAQAIEDLTRLAGDDRFRVSQVLNQSALAVLTQLVTQRCAERGYVTAEAAAAGAGASTTYSMTRDESNRRFVCHITQVAELAGHNIAVRTSISGTRKLRLEVHVPFGSNGQDVTIASAEARVVIEGAPKR